MIDEFLNEQVGAIRIFKNAVQKNKCSHAYIIETNNYIKKKEFVLAIVKYLQCEKKYTNTTLCGNCTQCKNIDNSSFSEVINIYPDGMWIKKDQVCELQKKLETTSIQSNKRIYIIHDAEKLNASASNSILKFLEEPEDNIIAILMCDNIHQLLDTIVSRCQTVVLAKNNSSILTKKEQLKSYIGINSEDEYLENILKVIIKFIIKIENNNSILYTQKDFFDTIKTKEEFEIALSTMILFYKDVLNYKIKKEIEFFETNIEILNSVSNNNKLSNIVRKISILNNAKENIRYNLNLNLLLDKIIIDMGNEEKYE